MSICEKSADSNTVILQLLSHFRKHIGILPSKPIFSKSGAHNNFFSEFVFESASISSNSLPALLRVTAMHYS